MEKPVASRLYPDRVAPIILGDLFLLLDALAQTAARKFSKTPIALTLWPLSVEILYAKNIWLFAPSVWQDVKEFAY